MKDVILLKDNKVVTVSFSVDADAVVLGEGINVGDIYDPKTGTFSRPEPIAPDIDPATIPPQIIDEHLMSEEELAEKQAELASFEAGEEAEKQSLVGILTDKLRGLTK